MRSPPGALSIFTASAARDVTSGPAVRPVSAATPSHGVPGSNRAKPVGRGSALGGRERGGSVVGTVVELDVVVVVVRRVVGTPVVVVELVVVLLVVLLVVVELDVVVAASGADVSADRVGSDEHAASSATPHAHRPHRRTAPPTPETLRRAWVAVRAGTPTSADRDLGHPCGGGIDPLNSEAHSRPCLGRGSY